MKLIIVLVIVGTLLHHAKGARVACVNKGPYGGGGGGAFNDGTYAQVGGLPTVINIRSGAMIDRIQITYGQVPAPGHGGQGGGQRTPIILPPGVYINRVTGRSGGLIDQLQFYTNTGFSYGPYGGNGGGAFNADPGYRNAKLQYISGRSGSMVDQLTFYFTDCTNGGGSGSQCINQGPYGGGGGGEFNDATYAQSGGFPTAINVRSGARIDRIQITYGQVPAPGHGGQGGGQRGPIILPPGVYINRVTGRSGSRIDQLQFYTNTGLSYGPWGGNGGGAFNADPGYSNAKLNYISGRSGSEVDQLTFYFTDCTNETPY